MPEVTWHCRMRLRMMPEVPRSQDPHIQANAPVWPHTNLVEIVPESLAGCHRGVQS